MTTTIIVKENIEDSDDQNDEYTWATNVGLQTKPKVLLKHQYIKKDLEASTLLEPPAPREKRFTKGFFDIKVRNNKGQYFNDMAWWQKAHPHKYSMRMFENCKELNDNGLTDKIKKVLREKMQEAMRLLKE